MQQPNLIATLRRRELDATGARLSAETGLPYTPPAGGERIAGTYRRRLTLTSGRYVVIDSDLGFALVPWTPALERQSRPRGQRCCQGERRHRMEFRAQRGLEI
jgi:hypothetical protein